MIELLLAAAALTFDRTVSCPIPVQGGVNVFALAADGPSADGHGAVQLTLPTSLGDAKQLVGVFGSSPGGVTVNLQWCKRARAIPLVRGTLPPLARLGRGGSLDDRCWAGAAVVVRVRGRLDAHGSVTSAQLAIRTGKKLRPLVFVDWTAKHVAVYGTDDCMPGP